MYRRTGSIWNRLFSATVFTILALTAGPRCTSTPTDVKLTKPVDAYPLTIGTEWQYAVRMTLYHNQTLIHSMPSSHTVSITDTLRMMSTGELAAVWTAHPPVPMQYGDTVEQLFVTSSVSSHGGEVDTIRFYDSLSAIDSRFVFITPADSGQSWNRACGVTELLADSAVIVPAGTFNDAQHVFALCGSYEWNEWLVSGIGMVGSHSIFSTYDGSSVWFYQHVTFELTSYHIEAP